MRKHPAFVALVTAGILGIPAGMALAAWLMPFPEPIGASWVAGMTIACFLCGGGQFVLGLAATMFSETPRPRE